MDLLEGIKGNKFVVFGRAGMDMFADPVGTKSEFADTFKSYHELSILVACFCLLCFVFSVIFINSDPTLSLK